ncbi:hypothetical protein GYMLUDRAFT_39242 [Collybiopsis luxurians FD-317 M1]|nr:hypothetical protein GYMLUDRAFT_39242 [Collybiopsis luxurians FD-317 M1]
MACNVSASCFCFCSLTSGSGPFKTGYHLREVVCLLACQDDENGIQVDCIFGVQDIQNSLVKPDPNPSQSKEAHVPTVHAYYTGICTGRCAQELQTSREHTYNADPPQLQIVYAVADDPATSVSRGKTARIGCGPRRVPVSPVGGTIMYQCIRTASVLLGVRRGYRLTHACTGALAVAARRTTW